MQGLFFKMLLLREKPVVFRPASTLPNTPNLSPSPSSVPFPSAPDQTTDGVTDSAAADPNNTLPDPSVDTANQASSSDNTGSLGTSARNGTTANTEEMMGTVGPVERTVSGPQTSATVIAQLARSSSYDSCLETSTSQSVSASMQQRAAATDITHMPRQGTCNECLHRCTGSSQESSLYAGGCGDLGVQLSVSCSFSSSSSSASFAGTEESFPVTLWVHKFRRFSLNWFLFPYVLHSTIEYKGVHFTFGGGGIYTSDPANEGWAVIRCIPMGETIVPCSAETTMLSDWILSSYTGETYSKLQHNCNDYCNEMCWMLVRKEAPIWINQLARMGERLLRLKPLPLALTQRPLAPLIDPQESQALQTSQTPSTADLSSNTLSSCTPPTPASVSSGFLACSAQESPAFHTSLHNTTQIIPPQQGTPPTEDTLHDSSNLTTPDMQASSSSPHSSPESSVPETVIPSQQPTSQPEIEVEPSAHPPVLPPDASAPPTPTPGKKHRPNWAKPVWPKNFRQKVASLFCCGRAPTVTSD